MSGRDGLYDVFTGKGVLPAHWSASGVHTSYDPETKNMTFEMPKGWTDAMTGTTRIVRRELWSKVDDPAYEVEYTLKISKTPHASLVENDGPEESSESPEIPRTKLVVAEHDDGTIEFRTNIDFEGVRAVPRGSDLYVSLCARAKIFKGEPVRIPLIEGRARVPEETLWLGKNTPGFFFVVDGGLVLSFHALREEDAKDGLRVTHVSFCGKTKHMNRWYTDE